MYAATQNAALRLFLVKNENQASLVCFRKGTMQKINLIHLRANAHSSSIFACKVVLLSADLDLFVKQWKWVLVKIYY